MKFCGISVKSKFFLAPMAEVSNLPFRLLCRKHGAGLVFTEQIPAMQLMKRKKEEIEAMKTSKEERPCAVQLFGNNAGHFAEAAKMCNDFSMININCGCPNHSITSHGAGSALLKEPKKIAEIITAVKQVTKKPVSVKIRLGWKKDEPLKIARAAEAAGADAVIIHARTAVQGYGGKAEWKSIGKVSGKLSVPVVANGDIISPESAEECLKLSGAEFAMIGRAAMANPFIFKEIDSYFKGKNRHASDGDKLALFMEYKKLCEKTGILSLNDLRQKAMYFITGLRGARVMRGRLSTAKNLEQVEEVLFH